MKAKLTEKGSIKVTLSIEEADLLDHVLAYSVGRPVSLNRDDVVQLWISFGDVIDAISAWNQ